MDLLSPQQLNGHSIQMSRSDPRHLSNTLVGPALPETPEDSVGNLLLKAMGQVNDLQQQSLSLTQQMIIDPDSVEIHDVTIALAEANLSLSMTKTIMDRALRAYREIISTR